MRYLRSLVVPIALACMLLASFASSPALAAPAPQFYGMAPDLVAYIKNGYKPVIMPEDKMTPSSTGFATERGPDRPIPNCVQPPANFDVATATPAQLKYYDIAPQSPGESRAHWLYFASFDKHRVCTTYSTNAYNPGMTTTPTPTGRSMCERPNTGTPCSASLEYQNDIWTGKIADQNCGSTGGGVACDDGTHYYTEIDTDYYINCPNGDTSEMTDDWYVWNGAPAYGSASEWVGLGGTSYNYDELQQAGFDVPLLGIPPYTGDLMPFYEWVGAPSIGGTVSEQGFYLNANCGDHVYVKVYNGNCYDVGDLNHSSWFNECYGPTASTQSAEAIIERNGAKANGTYVGEPWGVTTTFYGVGVTDLEMSPNYQSLVSDQHDYENTVIYGGYVSTTGPGQYDAGDPPYDEYTLTLQNPCGGASSCQ